MTLSDFAKTLEKNKSSRSLALDKSGMLGTVTKRVRETFGKSSG